MDDEVRRAEFEELARGLVEPLRRFLLRRTDPATADDVLADTLLVCWRRADQIPAEALPWAYGVARNCLANAERGERRQRRLAAKVASAGVPDVVPDPAEGSGDEAVTAALAALRPPDAELLRLWAWEQLGPGEIATVLGITPNAASIRLHRARQKLADELRKVDGRVGHEESREGRRP
ncbi:RNA polymerase sigma factor [Nocardioides lianchengensis]|uniref:RNA polymerase sigma-70 factor, ECF subfamily n=1 Tax=Nocardioides lianchengensis TaxID=1045774 RepID=A0A1G6I3I5_9ACTN|nr:sigma-70 family RNA polymerase sigma factor [Nocardioides lianchengensis]NYG13185.1 RNA polymerase sigma-70 factor (ECF subfamily) [Nocardioides lianchengensis]SDC00990.1 RNA polymerase sigma-70 factor, ECF subfamily [Nocardioides lianchengensis]